MQSHVSYDGKLQRAILVKVAPLDAVFVSRGKWVNPNGSYHGAAWVNLYFLEGTGFFALK